MQIAHIVPRTLTKMPTRGSQSRIIHINRALQKRYNVQIITPGRFGLALSKHLSFIGDRKPIATLGHLHTFRALRKTVQSADIAIVEGPWAFPFCYTSMTPLIYSSHNVEFDKFSSYAKALRHPPLPYASLVYLVERFAVKNADVVIAVSDKDAARFSEVYDIPAERIWVIPNASATIELAPPTLNDRQRAREALSLGPEPVGVFLGGSDGPPNREGFRLVECVAQRLGHVRFIVTGHVATKENRGNLLILGNIPEIRVALAAADFALCPIEFGGGTKIKLLDSVGYGLPTICFRESLQGFHSSLSRYVLISPSSLDGLIACIETLVANLNEYAPIGSAGREYMRRHYSWLQVSDLLCQKINDRYYRCLI